MYYPTTPGTYGYYCTGFESPDEWGDPQIFFPLDGQNVHYPGVQTENMQYVFYTPSYGYGTYLPGQLVGQQYIAAPTYQPLSQPTGYLPVLVQPGGVGFSSSSSGASVGVNSGGTKSRPQTSGSVNGAAVSLVTGASRSNHHVQSGSKLLPGQQVVARSDRSSPTNSQGKNEKSVKLTEEMDQLSVTSASGKSRPTSQSKSNGTPSPAADQLESALKTMQESGSKKKSDVIVICLEQYSGVDFSVDLPEARFFVIKSYSEDDVHKSIKYNVWSSTPNGNRRLDSVYSDALRRGCPLFLFFSVNASGQFCGVAEMVGPVDYSKDMDFWQQDKWSGSFPVIWHIIKDISNSAFRHITLQNNDNKPVTNSRDTQEIPYDVGITMLKIFKKTALTTSVLDDFSFYEERQKTMLIHRCRRLGWPFSSSLYIPALVSPSGKTRSSTDQSANDLPPEEVNGGTESEDNVCDKSEDGEIGVVKVGSVDIKVKECSCETEIASLVASRSEKSSEPDT